MIQSSRSPRAALTIIEIIVTLAILSAVAALASTLMRPSSPRLKLESVTRGLCATLRATKSRATFTKIPTIIIFDLDAKTYISPVAGLTKMPKKINIGLDIARNETHAQKAAIRFFPDGGASGGNIRLSLDGRRAKISINWMTGGVECASDINDAAVSP